MNTLRHLQERLQSYVLEDDRGIEEQVISTSKISACARLEIYAEAYRLRLLGALENDFPALKALLGNEAFSKLGRTYIEAHPSHHFSLRYFGRHLKRFLTHTSPYRQAPWLAEMAAFEWALGEVFDAADSRTLTLDEIATIPPMKWAQMRLHFHPSVHRLDLHWNVPLLWKAIDQHESPGPPVESHIPLPWVLWRQDLKNYFRSLKEDEAWALDAAQAGKTFGTICEGLCIWHEEAKVPQQAAILLQRWVTDGLLSRIDIKLP
jgi:hypothetical protein